MTTLAELNRCKQGLLVRGLLFGIQIPDGAIHVEIRPSVGSGRRRAIYRGALEEDGALLTEEVIADRIAADTAFWEHVESSRDASKLPAGKRGHLECRVSLQFLDQAGCALSLTDGGDTWQQSRESFDFYQRKGGRSEAPRRRRDSARAVGKALAAIMPGIRDTVTAALRESAAVNKEALATNKELIEALKKQLEREAERVDVAITELADRAKGTTQAPAQNSGGLRTLIDLFGVAKEVKTFLN